jgi:gamma-glutamyl-gamma-aminobutyrate hydrolase PuuD
MVGICRGGQFLNVVCGGGMIQHIEGHQATEHEITIPYDSLYAEFDGEMMTSDHHQAMIPSEQAESYFNIGDVTEVACYHPYSSFTFAPTICFQPHPEWVGKDDPCRRLFFALIENEFELNTEKENASN